MPIRFSGLRIVTRARAERVAAAEIGPEDGRRAKQPAHQTLRHTADDGRLR